MDVLVCWEKDENVNLVTRKDIQFIGDGRVYANSRVKMWWAPAGAPAGIRKVRE